MKPVSLGRMTVRKVFEMESNPPLPLILPDVTGEDLARLARWYDDETLVAAPAQSLFRMSMHSYVLQAGGRNILIDACNGDHKTRSIPDVDRVQTPYLANLAAQGFRPEDIHVVLCTHLHFDHVGWNTRLENGRWVPTFPNARYVFSRRDFEHFGALEVEDDQVRAFRDSVLPVYEAGRAQLIEPDIALHEAVDERVWLEPAFGHSPGNFSVLADGGSRRALFWGDVVHHPIQLVNLSLLPPFDTDPALAREVRLRTLARAADEQLICFPAHFRAPSAGQVARDGEAFRYRFLDE